MPDRMTYRIGAVRIAIVMVALVAVVVLALAGCSSSGDGSSSTTPSSTTLSTSAVTPLQVTKVPSIARLVPPEIASRGSLSVGVDLPYEPGAFTDDDGTIIGFDVDLIGAVSTVLGLKPVLTEANFPTILSSVADGNFDTGIPALTDTLEREQVVDFVTYYSAGNQWARRTGTDVTAAQACGKKVAVKKATYQDTVEVQARSTACVAKGEPPIDKVRLDTQDDVVEALVDGKVDAMSADSPVTAIAVSESDGKIEAIPGVFGSAPYGFPVQKGSSLGPAIQQAVQYLIDNGQYEQIATKWKMQGGMVPSSLINDAVR